MRGSPAPIPLAATLRAELQAWQRTRVNVDYLSFVGRIWRAHGEDSPVIEHARLTAGVDAALQAIEHVPPLSFLVIGEAGVGKTALIRSLGTRLQEKGWTLFQASAVDVLAGQTFIGTRKAHPRAARQPPRRQTHRLVRARLPRVVLRRPASLQPGGGAGHAAAGGGERADLHSGRGAAA